MVASATCNVCHWLFNPSNLWHRYDFEQVVSTSSVNCLIVPTEPCSVSAICKCCSEGRRSWLSLRQSTRASTLRTAVQLWGNPSTAKVNAKPSQQSSVFPVNLCLNAHSASLTRWNPAPHTKRPTSRAVQRFPGLWGG